MRVKKLEVRARMREEIEKTKLADAKREKPNYIQDTGMTFDWRWPAVPDTAKSGLYYAM